MAEAASRPLALAARGLTKKYQSLTAVAGIDLSVARGECVALLGPNGAGKTTTVEMLEGLTAPDAGTIEILGRSLAKERRWVLERIGVLLQETNLYKRYTVRETLELFASFYERSLAPDAIIDRLQLREKADVQLRKLSGGQKQRAYLGCSLINDPDLLFLDEPTTGLDPQARRAVWDLLAGLKGEGKSMLLTTHYMEEAEVLADRVAIIDHGKIIAEDAPRALVSGLLGGQLLRVELAPSAGGPQLEPEVLKGRIAERLPWFAEATIEPAGGFEIAVPEAAARVQATFEAARALGLTVKTLQLRRGTLEDVFLKLTGRSMRDA